MFKLVHYWNYAHVTPRREATIGSGSVLAPNVTLRNGSRVQLGRGCRVGANSSLWAGNSSGRVIIGNDVLIGPEVFITASNYEIPRGQPVTEQGTIETDVIIGDNVWLGRGVTVLPGVTIGDGCVIGAGSVVAKSLPPESIAVGSPARVVAERQ